jgi:hypothetical protein
MKKYLLFAALSGCVWAGIAYLLSFGLFPPNVVLGGLLVSPLIGLLVGWIFLPAYKLPRFVQFALSLATLYVAVALFGLAVGLSDAAREIANRGTAEVILQAMVACIMGVTFGYVLVLWPLAYLNHRLLAHAYRGPITTRGPERPKERMKYEG